MARDPLLVALLALSACRAAPSPRMSDAEADASPAPSAAAVSSSPTVEDPPVYSSFDAGGRTEIEVPTVRCDDDGMVGWTRVFPPPTWKVKVTKELLALDDPQSQLRVYISPFWVVLGPPGFRCVGWSGSSGSSLAVVPADMIRADGSLDKRAMDGELVHARAFSWMTSGRLPAAALASRIFPSQLRARLQRLYDWDLGIRDMALSTAPYPGELVTVDGLHARYVDPAGVAGVAAEGGEVRPNDAPIHGSLVHVEGAPRYADADAMVVLAVRLVAERDPLIATIIVDFDAGTRGSDTGSARVFDLPRCYDTIDMRDPRCPHEH